MSRNLRDEMPTVAAFLDDLRSVFGKEMIDKQIRSGIKGAPTFWACEGGHKLGTRNTEHSCSIEWDEAGISYAATPEWVIEMRAFARKRGLNIRPAEPGDYGDMKREADEYRTLLASLKNTNACKKG